MSTKGNSSKQFKNWVLTLPRIPKHDKKKESQRGKAEKAFRFYCQRQGGTVVRGGLLLLISLGPRKFPYNLNSEQKLYFLMLLVPMIGESNEESTRLAERYELRIDEERQSSYFWNNFFWRQFGNARLAYSRMSAKERKALHEIAKTWPNPRPMSGVPDFFVYFRKKKKPSFFAEVKFGRESIRETQKTAAKVLHEGGFQVFLYRKNEEKWEINPFSR